MLRDLLRRSRADQLAAGVAALGAEVDDPVAGADHVEVVLDHQQRVAGVQQLAEGAQQLGDVVEVQAGGRLVEQEQLARLRAAGLGEVAGELQALRFAARERRHRLAEAQVVEADVLQRAQRRHQLGFVAEEVERLGDGQLEHVGDRLAVDLDLEDLGAEAPAVAVRAAQVDVGEELHLDVLEAVAAAGRAAAVARVEAEGAGGVLPLLRFDRIGKQLSDRIEGADIARRVGARGLADRRLVDHHHVVDLVGAVQRAVRARRLGRLALGLAQRRVEHVLHQRRLARARDAGDAHQALERDGDVDVLEVVLGWRLSISGTFWLGRRVCVVSSAFLRPERYSAVIVFSFLN